MGPPFEEVASQGNASSEELPGQVEADVPVVTAARAAREGGEGGGEVVREVELERVAADALLDAEAQVVGGALRGTDGIDPLEAGEPWRQLADDVGGRAG